MFKFIRWALGGPLLLVNWLTQPKPAQRATEEQTKINERVKDLSLYQFETCPFCIKVRRHLRRLNLPIELRDARNNETHRRDLLTEGGKVQAPCLRIVQADGTSQWLYESSDIIEYLDKTFPIAQ